MRSFLPTPRLLAALFLFGGIGGLLCDQIHVRWDVLSYPNPMLLDQAWWVAPVFAAGTVVMFIAASPFAERSPLGDRLAEPRTLGVASLWFLGAYFASGVFAAHPVALTATFVALWLLRALLTGAGAAALGFAILLAAGGTLFEGTLSGTGAFHYHRPDFFRVPLWLPGLYLHGAPLALALARRFGPRPSASEEAG